MVAAIVRPYAIWQPPARMADRYIGTLLDEYGARNEDVWRRCILAYAQGHPVEIYRLSADKMEPISDLAAACAKASTPIVGGSLSVHTVYYHRGEPCGYGVEYLLPAGS